MSSNLTVQTDQNIAVLQQFVSQKEGYSRLQAFISSGDVKLGEELQGKLRLGFWNRFVIAILSIFSPELSAKKVASFVSRYMSELKKPEPVERIAENLIDLGLGQYAYLFI